MQNKLGRVYYGLGMKLLTILIALFSIFVAYAALHASEDQKIIAFLVALFFIASSLFLLYLAFFVEFKYGNDGIYYRSKEKLLPWSKLKEKGYSRWLDMNYLRFEEFGTSWVSAYMVGFDDFSNFLEQKVEELDSNYLSEESKEGNKENSIIQRLYTTVREKYPNLELEEDKNFFLVKAPNEMGFDIWINADGNESIVGYNGWHEHFENEQDAYEAFLFGLTSKCRLRVTMRGECQCSYRMEAFEDGQWRQYGSTVYPLCCFLFWRKKKILSLSNNME